MIPYFSFALLGALGLLGSSILFPLIALATELLKRRLPPAKLVPVGSLDILIPAHNEEKVIERTLVAIKEAIAGAVFPIRILVAADACTDETQTRATGHAAEVFPVGFQNKWKTLRALIDRSQAEWVALVDCGTLWTPALFTKAVLHCEHSDHLAVAPAYESSQAGFLADIHWKFEQILKLLESDAGGPVSLHGATIFYRRKELVEALAWLDRYSGGVPWLCDDVVIPLALRTIHPHGRIDYLSQWRGGAAVTDIGASQIREERRARMTRGNLQWMHILLGPVRDLNVEVYLIALRRVFRVFWAYWVLLLGMGVLHSVIAGLVFVLVAYFIPQREIWISFQAAWQWRKLRKQSRILASAK